jgi:hypothetical protein
LHSGTRTLLFPVLTHLGVCDPVAAPPLGVAIPPPPNTASPPEEEDEAARGGGAPDPALGVIMSFLKSSLVMRAEGGSLRSTEVGDRNSSEKNKI